MTTAKRLELAELIRASLLGVAPDSQDVVLEDHDWLEIIAALGGDENCPGHVASAHDAKICGRCGIHIDELRPA